MSGLQQSELDAREARLPVWARRELALLRSNLAAERARMSVLLGENEPTGVLVDPYREPPHYLPAHTTVRFTPDHVGWVDVRLRNERVEIMGERSLVAYPQVSNVLTVVVSPR